MKRRFATVLLAGVMACSSVVNVGAYEISRNAAELGIDFSKNYGVYMVYKEGKYWADAGFRKILIYKEDYCGGWNKTKGFTVKVHNGIYSDTKKGEKNKSKTASVTHLTKVVTYTYSH
ncbi:MAG: hypothetical protein K6G88_08775 [Lachnospiraceae bacterium]|nr:hypothetical protein [Lachnospiraceae bacterium]